MMEDRTYRWLMEAASPSTGDAFDHHVFASILAVAVAQARSLGAPLSLTSGLDSAEIAALSGALFPGAAKGLAAMAGSEAPCPGPEEQSIRDILLMYGTGELALLKPLALMIARRCQEPHHLWQDLGLRNRGELSELMTRHFPRLKARNSADMKWKKFLYRMVCASEGFTLCPAPVCSDCNDFAACFGSEEGVAQLSHSYREERV
jgi:nitrogen fixation protein NifQ